MKYKKFVRWCNDRAFDGCWGFHEATICLNIIDSIKKFPFWKREKEWKKISNEVLNTIVIPINQKIERMINNHERNDEK